MQRIYFVDTQYSLLSKDEIISDIKDAGYEIFRKIPKKAPPANEIRYVELNDIIADEEYLPRTKFSLTPNRVRRFNIVLTLGGRPIGGIRTEEPKFVLWPTDAPIATLRAIMVHLGVLPERPPKWEGTIGADVECLAYSPIKRRAIHGTLVIDDHIETPDGEVGLDGWNVLIELRPRPVHITETDELVERLYRLADAVPTETLTFLSLEEMEIEDDSEEPRIDDVPVGFHIHFQPYEDDRDMPEQEASALAEALCSTLRPIFNNLKSQLVRESRDYGIPVDYRMQWEIHGGFEWRETPAVILESAKLAKEYLRLAAFVVAYTRANGFTIMNENEIKRLRRKAEEIENFAKMELELVPA